MNEGCVVMGKPHPSHLFTEPHIWSTKLTEQPKKKLATDEILTDEKSMFAKGLIVHPIV